MPYAPNLSSKLWPSACQLPEQPELARLTFRSPGMTWNNTTPELHDNNADCPNMRYRRNNQHLIDSARHISDPRGWFSHNADQQARIQKDEAQERGSLIIAERRKISPVSWKKPVRNTHSELEKPANKEDMSVGWRKPVAPVSRHRSIGQHQPTECEAECQPDQCCADHSDTYGIHVTPVDSRMVRLITVSRTRFGRDLSNYCRLPVRMALVTSSRIGSASYPRIRATSASVLFSRPS